MNSVDRYLKENSDDLTNYSFNKEDIDSVGSIIIETIKILKDQK